LGGRIDAADEGCSGSNFDASHATWRAVQRQAASLRKLYKRFIIFYQRRMN
jgi:hypothetical protein